MEDIKQSLSDVMNSIYLKYKLNFYQNLYYDNGSSEESLTVMEKFCAEAIFALQGPTVNQLAQFIRVSQPNAAYKVNNLVKKGHVEKVRSQKDRRQVHLFVTDKYKEQYHVNYRYVDEIIDCLQERVTDEELATFKKILEIMDDGVLKHVSDVLKKENSRF